MSKKKHLEFIKNFKCKRTSLLDAFERSRKKTFLQYFACRRIFSGSRVIAEKATYLFLRSLKGYT